MDDGPVVAWWLDGVVDVLVRAMLVAAIAVGPAVVTAAAARRRLPTRAVGRVATGSLLVAAAAAVVLAMLGPVDEAWPDGGLRPWVVTDVDRTSAVLIVTFLVLGAIVSTFSGRAFDDERRGVVHQLWLCALVGGSVLVAAPGGPVPLLVGWIGSAWALDRLVSGWVGSSTAAAAQRRLRRDTQVGNVALAGAIAVAVLTAGAGAVAGSQRAIDELASTSIGGVGAGTVFALLIVVAGVARSAQVPFHRWLTATLYAPTPVSALVHAGYVSGAGLLLIRFAPIVSAVDVAIIVVGAVAIATIVVGSAASLTRPDVKGALAWSTVAQMGFMVVQCAVGAFAGAVVHIVGHGMYKAAQFLGAGDTITAALRKRRRPLDAGGAGTPRLRRATIVVLVPTVAVGVGLLVGPAGLDGAERLLLVGAAWLAIAAAVHGALSAGTLRAGSMIAVSSVAAVALSAAYFAGLRVVKRFLEPSLIGIEPDGAVAATLAVATLVALVAVALVVQLPGTNGLRDRLRWWVELVSETRPRLDPGRQVRRGQLQSVPATPATSALDERSRSELRDRVRQAVSSVAPAWPLSSFVAVNPLGGLEDRVFGDAAVRSIALGGRPYRSLEQYRDDHRRGLTTAQDLDRAVAEIAFEVCSRPPLEVGARTIAIHEIVVTDAMHGPETPDRMRPRTELERRFGVGSAERWGVDELVASWVLDHMGRPSWALGDPTAPFFSTARAQMRRHARRRLGPSAVRFVESLGDDPVDALGRALTASGIPPAGQVEELTGLLTSMRGCAGLARWRNEWAHADESLPSLSPVELVAAQAMVHAAVIIDRDQRPVSRHDDPATGEGAGGPNDRLAERVDAVVEQLQLASDATARHSVASVVAALPDPVRHSIWQRAQELRFDDQMLTLFDRLDPGGRIDRPASQVVMCIDVRSEGLRRHLEAHGLDETIGFAGFFGVPMRVRELGWQHPEPRCPVLVAPHALAEERALPGHTADVARELRTRRAKASVAIAHTATKQLAGAQFATAEAAGWITGPLAAWRTLVPPRRPLDVGPGRPTTIALDDSAAVDQLTYSAEAVLRTMGLTDRFARLVLLCGHTSDNVNNPHATALDCGACAGASGASNARAVAALLNRLDVRGALRARGIDVPDDTWFVGAVHETTSDDVTVLDANLVPPTHRNDLAALRERLRVAARRQADDRARHLPGPARRVRDRGRDWAETRPEWGLATNAAFVIAPRSATADLDLGGRCFLHSYDARHDPDGTVLETIMTAPLVVGHWISAQYYFSATDPDTYGAGDKLLHNPVGTIGVLTGAAGDLRVGLPLQSTHVAGRSHHQPLRLLAVVQAELAVIEAIIARNPVLQRLVGGSWLRLAARSHHHEPWSTRTPNGTWEVWPRPADRQPSLERL